MFLRHLSYFVTLAREKHFARAAEVCHISQPTLSAAIHKLEQDLQARLVIRGHRFLGLTAEGERVLVWARQILSDYDGLRIDLTGLRSGLSGSLRLGAVPAAMPLVSCLTARFSSAHPAATVEVTSMTSRSIQKGLDSFELDAGITYLDNEPLERVRRIPLYRERYIFLTGAGSRYEGRRTISWREAAGERLCLLSEDMQNRRIIDAVFDSLGIKPKPPVVSNSFLGICSHLRYGGFASIVPHTFFYVFAATRDLVGIDLIEPAHTQSIGLVLSDRDPLPPMASALIACARNAGLAEALAAAAACGKNDQPFQSIVQNISLDKDRI
jgi:DNA-binding transcriptional LysR family regulator